jgi:hypothetical protein
MGDLPVTWCGAAECAIARRWNPYVVVLMKSQMHVE